MLKNLLRRVRAEGFEPIANALPEAALARIFEGATRSWEIAICLHRVLPQQRPFMQSPGLAHTPEELDAFLRISKKAWSRLTMTFDDGYRDAYTYVLSRAKLHPEVRWKFMICPAKTTGRFGFAWDRWIVDAEPGDEDVFMKSWRTSFSRVQEHQIRATPIGDMDDYRLATIDECSALMAQPNIELGNHSDHHYPLAWMNDDDVVAELEESRDCFAKYFGPPKHFAFPFGTPTFVSRRCIQKASDTHGTKIWTVDIHPNGPDRAGPEWTWSRFPWDSTQFSPKAMALYIAMKCLMDSGKRTNSDIHLGGS